MEDDDGGRGERDVLVNGSLGSLLATNFGVSCVMLCCRPVLKLDNAVQPTTLSSLL